MKVYYAAALVAGVAGNMIRADAGPIDQHLWKARVLVVSAPADSADVEEQRRIYRSANRAMSERQIVLVEALDDSEASQQIRSKVSADGKRFQVFLVGKDGHTAISSDQPLSADYLIGKVDAMPMRRDEMRQGH